MAKRVRDIGRDDEQGPPPQIARIEELLREEFATMPREMRAAIESHLAIRPLLRHAQASKELWGDVERPMRVAFLDHILRNLDWKVYNTLTAEEKGKLERAVRDLHKKPDRYDGANYSELKIPGLINIANDARFFRLFTNFNDLEHSNMRVVGMTRAQILSFYRETMDALVESISFWFQQWWTDMRRKAHLFRFMIFPTTNTIPPLHWQQPVTGELCSITLSLADEEMNGGAAFTVTGNDSSDPVVAKIVENFSDTFSMQRVRNDEIMNALKNLLFDFFYDVSPACVAVFQDITPNVNATQRYFNRRISLSTNGFYEKLSDEKN